MTRDSVIVVGGSRGVGAVLTRRLVAQGVNVLVVCRRERPRLYHLLRDCSAYPGRVEVLLLDLSQPGGADTIWDWIDLRQWRPGTVYLCASGGMEPGMGAQAIRQLNTHTPEQIIDVGARRGHRITAWLLTSHQAHFVQSVAVEPEYQAVALTKNAGEQAIVDRSPHWHRLGVRVGIASSDVISDSVTTMLMERNRPGSLQERRDLAGMELPTTEQVAEWLLGLQAPGTPRPSVVLMSPYPSTV